MILLSIIQPSAALINYWSAPFIFSFFSARLANRALLSNIAQISQTARVEKLANLVGAR